MQFNVIVLVTIFHLVILNLFLGILEGGLLMLKNRGKTYFAIPWMTVANYFSWTVGFILIYIMQNYVAYLITNFAFIFPFWIFCLIVLFPITYTIKLPFFLICVKTELLDKRKATKYFIRMEFIIYLILISLYLAASNFNFFTSFSVNQQLLSQNFDYELYLYNDNQVYTCILDSVVQPKLYEPLKNDSIKNASRFALLKNIRQKNHDLVLVLNQASIEHQMIKEGFIGAHDSNIIATVCDLSDYYYQDDYFDLYYEAGYSETSLDFRHVSEKYWYIKAHNSMREGFSIITADTISTTYSFAFPWVNFKSAQPTILDSGLVLMLIDKRLVLMNIETKEIAYITRADSYAVRKLK